jgi:hypothetical protein
MLLLLLLLLPLLLLLLLPLLLLPHRSRCRALPQRRQGAPASAAV